MTAPLIDDITRPVVRLMPKANARAIRHGFPWVYANEMVTDRRTKALAPGALAVLQDELRQPLGLVSVNPNSKIIARVLDTDPDAQLDHEWFVAKIARALKLREQLFDAPFYRLIHAEADGLPGVVIDRFGDTCVIQPNAAWADTHLPMLVAAVAEVTGISNILKNAAGRTRALEGLDDESGVVIGAAPEGPIPVAMNGAICSYRHAMELLNKLVYAEPTNTEAKDLLADVFEQLGYQYESASVRHVFLSSSEELRNGVKPFESPRGGSPTVARAMTTGQWWDAVATRVDSQAADEINFVLNFITPDTGQTFVVEMSGGTLSNIEGYSAPNPDATITMNRSDVETIIMGQATLGSQLQNGVGTVTGNAALLMQLNSVLVSFDPSFEVIPGTLNP